MKTVFTLFQCKRVALPYFFSNYAYPAMKRLLGGDTRLYIIQHTGNLPRRSRRTVTASLDDDKLDLVRRWTDEGRYCQATIISHSESTPKLYPTLLPSYRIGIEIALQEKADLHVWLEDDALIHDENCTRWAEAIGDRDVGVFRPDCQHIHCAYVISRPAFDRRLLPLFSLDSLEHIRHDFAPGDTWIPKPGHIEYCMSWASQTDRGVLPSSSAVRMHPGVDPTGVVNLVKRLAPADELPLLSIDFPGVL